MNRPELYKKTTDILFAAYFNDTLENGICTACAVGNIIAANMGYSFSKKCWISNQQQLMITEWDTVFITLGGSQKINPTQYRDEAKKQIDSTGYHWQELAKIEFAFETADKGNSDEDYMFNGLVAVLEVLKSIHQVEDITPDLTRFRNHYSSLVK